MGNYSKGYNAGKNDKGYYANRPKNGGILGTTIGQASSTDKAQKKFDNGWSKGRNERRSKQSGWKNFWE